MTILLWTQPLLIGLFLGGDYDKLAAHLAVGGVLVSLMLLQFLASVPAWRPGGLPGWVVAVCAAMAVGGVVQIAAGFQRNLGLHVPLGVTLAAAGFSGRHSRVVADPAGQRRRRGSRRDEAQPP